MVERSRNNTGERKRYGETNTIETGFKTSYEDSGITRAGRTHGIGTKLWLINGNGLIVTNKGFDLKYKVFFGHS